MIKDENDKQVGNIAMVFFEAQKNQIITTNVKKTLRAFCDKRSSKLGNIDQNIDRAIKTMCISWFDQ